MARSMALIDTEPLKIQKGTLATSQNLPAAQSVKGAGFAKVGTKKKP
jgi:hypothetical protein